eukprot:TRINITY_DN5087_c0_g3_i1.p1 TRINITY_DN5087_c0_g3~~TRINITY_DN5087_c0_g3_i1.p1  ORF type:complete len:458 (-),score=92.02 TRINITY_DN5087_c0_g3_i1:773-2146(-)
MESLDTLVSHVQDLSNTREGLATLSLQLGGSEDFLSKHTAKLGPLLTTLDATHHSLGYLYIMEAQLTAVPSPVKPDVAIGAIITFLNKCKANQIRLAPEKFSSLCSKLRDLAVAQKEYLRPIAALGEAIRKIQPTPEHLTPQHAHFAQMCLLAKCYGTALPVLSEDLLEVDFKKTGLQTRDFLLYCYYGGMIYTGVKQYQRAIELFQHTLTAPTNAISAISVAAYKKYMLLSLIVNGTVPSFPKVTSIVVQRNLKQLSAPYHSFAVSYSNRNPEELKESLATHEQAFKNDSNLGLAKQAVASMYKRNIQRLTQTYLTLSLEDIARIVKLADTREAEMHVLKMIEAGEIFASINQKDGMVRFLEDPEQYNSKEMGAKLDANIQQCIRLSKKVQALDEQISCDFNYVRKMTDGARGGRKSFMDDVYGLGMPSVGSLGGGWPGDPMDSMDSLSNVVSRFG